MTKSLALLASVIVVIALAAPAVDAQATRRGGSTSAPPAGGGGGGGGTRVAVPRDASPRPAPAPSSESGRPAARRSSVGAGATRPAAAPTAAGEGRVAPTARMSAPGSASARARSSQATRGVAQPRPIRPIYPVQPIYPVYPSYGYGYPYYGYGYPYYGYGSPYYGYGWSLSFGYGYPWYNGWHDPYFYAPYVHVHAPYYWSSSAGERTEGAEDSQTRTPTVATGSLRLRVNPSHARVYVDGALAGVASAFGGLTDHLVLPAGVHDLELRADGYTTASIQVDVKPDRTQTERINLKRE
jgi:hypothetical protein